MSRFSVSDWRPKVKRAAGAQVAPRAQPDDGFLELVQISRHDALTVLVPKR